ncbi:MAG: ABC-ATPase domain-containing protein [Gammaproteobacteria bacterium]|nr:ABC-ATPase domain-containing protein [Gammaproteobacteria bacterium]
MQQLISVLKRIDGKGYKAYKDIQGIYTFDGFKLRVDHVQGDPFAAPSRIAVIIKTDESGFEPAWYANPSRRIALEDFLLRVFLRHCGTQRAGSCGSGKSGLLTAAAVGQQILQRNAVILNSETLELRCLVGLPANGRRILAQPAQKLLCEILPRIVQQSLFASSLDISSLLQQVKSVEDQDVLRNQLASQKLLSFIADGSSLARLTGVNDQPLPGAVKFISPESLRCEFDLPNRGKVSGMGLAEGVNLIVGGGFHGKSTLLHAIERGIYNHIPGDGRELVVTRTDAVKVRAEDGRAVNALDISYFINNLPMQRDTRKFSTANASGSTSQAASILEALACGSRLLLMDEDTSATNFMIRDARMQALVAADKEPITPFLASVRDCFDKQGISSILVMGGSGDYFSVSDTVIMLDNYRVIDVSERAKSLASELTIQNNQAALNLSARQPQSDVLQGRRGTREFKFDIYGVHELIYGDSTIDLSGLQQLVDRAQVETIAWVMRHYEKSFMNNSADLLTNVQIILDRMQTEGFDCLPDYTLGSLAEVRAFDICATINRIREGQWRQL